MMGEEPAYEMDDIDDAMDNTGNESTVRVNLYAFNTYNAAGVSRRQDQHLTNLVKNVNILEFGYYI